MLRVLSKALARHLQKYPDQGLTSYTTVPDCVNKFSTQCQRPEKSPSPCRSSTDVESLTPQLEKHLHVKNSYIPDIVQGMRSVARKRYQEEEEYDKLRRPSKAEQRALKRLSSDKAKKKRKRSMTSFATKCPVQVERIKQSISKREDLKCKSKQIETKNKPKSKEAKMKCESKVNLRHQYPSRWERDVESREPPKTALPEKVKKVDSDVCLEHIMFGWANLAKELSDKEMKVNKDGKGKNGKEVKEAQAQTRERVLCQTDDDHSPRSPKAKNDQLCYNCIEELWRGGHRGDCRTPLPVDSLQKMVKDQTDRLAGKLDLLGQKIEKDIKDILFSWEISTRKAKKAMEDAERNQAFDRSQNVKSMSSPFFGDYAHEPQKVQDSQSDLSFNESYEGEPLNENLSEKLSRTSLRSCEKEEQSTEKPWFQDAHSRLVGMLKRVRAAVNKSRALPNTMSQHNSTIARPLSTSNDSFTQKKEIEELYGLISAKGETIAKEIQNRIRKALKELKN